MEALSEAEEDGRLHDGTLEGSETSETSQIALNNTEKNCEILVFYKYSYMYLKAFNTAII